MQVHAEPAYDMIRDAHTLGDARPLIVAGGPKAIYEPTDFLEFGPRPGLGADCVVTGEVFVLLQLLETVLGAEGLTTSQRGRGTFVATVPSGLGGRLRTAINDPSSSDIRFDILDALSGVALPQTLVQGAATYPDYVFVRKVHVQDEVEIVGLGAHKKTIVTGVEMFRKELEEGMAGDNVGVLLRGIEKTDLERGQVLAAPGSITPHTKFKAKAYILTKEEGGRHTPFFKGYRPQFYFRTTDVTGEAERPAGMEMGMPGDNVELVVELIQPIAVEKELRFAIREGGRTVGAGVVHEIIA
jgi:hypothetical protein